MLKKIQASDPAYPFSISKEAAVELSTPLISTATFAIL
jgi:uncharacterized protein (DUF2141 family)